MFHKIRTAYLRNQYERANADYMAFQGVRTGWSQQVARAKLNRLIHAERAYSYAINPATPARHFAGFTAGQLVLIFAGFANGGFVFGATVLRPLVGF